MMRSFHCPNLVRIESNADILSRFQSVVTGVARKGILNDYDKTLVWTMNYHWPAKKKKPFFFAPRCFHRLNYYLGKTDFFLRIFLILSVRFLRRNMRQDCCNPSPIVYSFYTERRAQNINLTENIQIKFYFMKDARKYRDMA